jgi:hypothetical protein
MSECCLPEKSLIELAGANEILKLLKPCESTVFEGLRGEINLAEKLVELLHPLSKSNSHWNSGKCLLILSK